MGLFYIRATGVRIFRAICSNCGAAPQLMRMARADFFLATQKLLGLRHEHVATMIIAPALGVCPAMITFAIVILRGAFAERRCARWTPKAMPLAVRKVLQ